MTDKQQIEEIAKVIESVKLYGADNYVRKISHDSVLELAKELLKHYQPKVPEDAVVLTREELSKRDYEFRQIGYDECLRDNPKKDIYIKALERKIDQLNAKLDQARKETAKEILQKIRNLLDETDQICSNPYSWEPEWGYCVKELEDRLKQLAKQYGVEVE